MTALLSGAAARPALAAGNVQKYIFNIAGRHNMLDAKLNRPIAKSDQAAPQEAQMKFNQLRDFVAVAEAGSLRGASRTLGLAQPAITRSIRELERALGVQLFARESRGVRLTPVGEDFLPRAIAILGDIRRAQEAVQSHQHQAEGELVVAFSVASHFSLLPAVLPPFLRRFPGVRLRLIEGLFPALEASLRSGQTDFYVGPVPPGQMPADLQATLLFENERVVVGRKGHPLAGARSLAELADAGWLTTSITRATDDELRSVFTERGLAPPRLGGQGHSALSILTLMLHADLLAMMPVQWVHSPVFGTYLEELPLSERFAAPPITLVQRAGLGHTPAGEYFQHLVEREAAALAAARAPAGAAGNASSDKIPLSGNQN